MDQFEHRREGATHVRASLDTFRTNIEEKSLGDGNRLVGERLVQVHTCEDDRGTPESGHTPWAELSEFLRDMSFTGSPTTE